MSESDDKATETTGSDSTEETPDTGGEPDWKAEAQKWKALSRKHENNAKANADAARRLKEAEDADKSEMEKLTERVTAAEQRASDAESKGLRAEVAHEKGLTSVQAKRLAGSSREELEADADDLLEAFGAKKNGDADGGSDDKPSRRPKEKLRPGASSENDAPEDYNKIADDVYKRTHGTM